MAILVAALTCAVLMLGVLVAGLLRSHAEILKSLHDLGAGIGEGDGVRSASDFRVQPGIPSPGESVSVGHDIAGTTPGDEALVIAITGVQQQTLVAFLSTGCLTCQEFWEVFAHADRLSLPERTRIVIVTKSATEESESAVAELAPEGIALVMSSDAWDDYKVPGSPYFVHVDGASGQVIGEGAATSWSQVASLIGQADRDRRLHRRSRKHTAGRLHPADRDRADLVDRELLAAGIAPGDPSLFPSAPIDDSADGTSPPGRPA
ncbi:MAG: hypothetical protein ABIM89_12890 [Mycobacteriales bacterium]